MLAHDHVLCCFYEDHGINNEILAFTEMLESQMFLFFLLCSLQVVGGNTNHKLEILRGNNEHSVEEW